MTIDFKYTATDATVSTDESTKDPERGPRTVSLSVADDLAISVSRQRGVLGRRSRDTITNVNGGHHEQ